MRIRSLMLVCIAVALAASCGGPAKSALQMNLVPSKAYRLSIRTDGTISAHDAAAGKPQAFSWELAYVMRVMQVYDNGDTGVSMTVERAKLLVIGPMLKGSTFTARVTPGGKVIELAGTEAIRERIRSSNAAKGNSALADPDNAIRQFSDEAILGSINPVFQIWPERPVALKDSWTRAAILIPFLRAHEHTEFRLAALHTSDARIEVESSLRRGAEPDSELIGSSSGEIHVAPGEGILRSYRAISTVNVKGSDTSSGIDGKVETTTYATFAPL